MKKSLFFKLCFSLIFSVCFLKAEDSDTNLDLPIGCGPWPIDSLLTISTRYYNSIEEKKLDNQINTLNNLSDVIIEKSILSKEELNTSRAVFARWGKKPCSVGRLYHVVEREDSEFKKVFKEIFGKSLKCYQAVCTTYRRNDKIDENISVAQDNSGMWDLGTFSTIDLWLMDEDGKCYVILSYEPAREFKYNMSKSALERLGIHNAQLWDK
jgi:hypothetical protein